MKTSEIVPGVAFYTVAVNFLSRIVFWYRLFVEKSKIIAAQKYKTPVIHKVVEVHLIWFRRVGYFLYC